MNQFLSLLSEYQVPAFWLVVLGIAIWWFRGWHATTNSRLKTLQDDVEKDRTTLQEFMKEIRDDIKKIFERLPAVVTSSKSPIGLTELGEQISEKVAAKAWARTEAEKLIGSTEGADALGVQETAFQYARDFDPPSELLGKMRASAFEGGVDLSSVRDVLGVELRDVLLERRAVHISSLVSEGFNLRSGVT